ncbi:hypothetical protein LCGC14_2889990, partial [marine sediment metagenome]
LVFNGCSKNIDIKASVLEPLEKSPSALLGVGDPMPDNSEIAIAGMYPWAYSPTGKSGMQLYRGDANGVWTMEAFLSCDGELLEKPFGLYTNELGAIYLDKNMDRIIDEVIVLGSIRLTIGETAPDCPLPGTKI